jgi:predicted GNAT family acetyltransferase
VASLAVPDASSLLVLGQADVPEMLALTAVTEPGPFVEATIRMGRYFGIRSSDGTLAAMAGERLRLDGLTEISAVCTDPRFQGRGHARELVTYLVALLASEGKVPFLHVKSENGAKSLYEKLGFRVRCEMRLTVLARP